MDLPMIRNFEIYTQRHIDEMMCEANKERTLSALRKAFAKPRMHSRSKMRELAPVPDNQLKECPVSPDLWASHV